MDNIRGFIDYIKNLFTDPLDSPRKRRRAFDAVESYSVPRKIIKLTSMDNDDWLTKKISPRKSSLNSVHARSPTIVNEVIILDDDDKKPCNNFTKSTTKLTSTPTDSRIRRNTFVINRDDEDDDVTFIREVKPARRSQSKTTNVTTKSPSISGSFFDLTIDRSSSQNGTKPKERFYSASNCLNSSRTNSSRMPVPCSSLNYSFRLDDKNKYRELLESTAALGNHSGTSVYNTPVGEFFGNGRSSKILGMALDKDGKSNTNGKLSTKERIIKVLDKYENDTVVIPDSDSDSDVILLPPPSPKPDIKVDPVNSLKTVNDTTQHLKSSWLQDVVQRHRLAIEERKKEIEAFTLSAEKHNKINSDIRMGLITSKINQALSIKDVVLPIQEIKEDVPLPKLTDDHLRLVQKAFQGDPNAVLARKFNLNITRRDLVTLSGLQWLNDEVINFYMNLIIERGKNSKWPKTYAMNTFFYSKLIKDGPQSLRRWTKRVDLFSYDLICVPIHLGMHWCMAVIDLRDRSIRYYDSMGAANNQCLEALLNYLQAEHQDKKSSALDVSKFVLENVSDIPQQMNGSDCGMFSCTFAEFLSRDASITFSQKDMPYFRKKMVVEIIEGQLMIH